LTAAMNTYRDKWLRAVIKDNAMRGGTRLVASAIACAMGPGQVAPTDWENLNAALRRERTDPAVLASISELQSAGYLERYLGNGGAHSHGWLLTLPG
jgi:hypothetical protein